MSNFRPFRGLILTAPPAFLTSEVVDGIGQYLYRDTVKNITVSLDDETYRRARVAAAELGTSVSNLVKRYLNEIGTGASEAERLRLREAALRETIADFRGSDRLSRDDVHRRDT